MIISIFIPLLIISDRFDYEAKTIREKKLFTGIKHDLLSLLSINKLIDSAYAGLFRVYRMSSTHTATEYNQRVKVCSDHQRSVDRYEQQLCLIELKMFKYWGIPDVFQIEFLVSNTARSLLWVEALIGFT